MIHAGMAGLGAWGWNVARSFASLPECRLVAGGGQAPKRLDAAAKAWPGLVGYKDYDEMLRHDKVEAVIIASSAVTHYQLVKKALMLDRDVFVEKPFTLNVAEAGEFADLSEKKRRILMVGHLLEYHPVVRQLKSMIHK